MKKLKYFSLAALALSLLPIPATAQKGKDRDNKGATNTGDTRADLVKSTNKMVKQNVNRADRKCSHQYVALKNRRRVLLLWIASASELFRICEG